MISVMQAHSASGTRYCMRYHCCHWGCPVDYPVSSHSIHCILAGQVETLPTNMILWDVPRPLTFTIIPSSFEAEIFYVPDAL